MAEYAKTLFSDVISIKSVITIFPFDLTGLEPIGETHDFWEFIYVNEGVFEVLVDNKPYVVKEGQMITYAPLSFHKGAKPNIAKLSIVSFESSSGIISDFANKVITLSGKQRQLLSQVVSLGKKCFKSVSPDSGFKGMEKRDDVDAYTLQSLKNQLELLLIDIYETERSKPSNLNLDARDNKMFDLLTQFLKDNMGKALTLEDICDSCSLSMYQLKQLCRKHCGMSPMSYFISLKIDAAKDMICDTNLSFTQISDSLGFTTVHYFSKLFKDKVGVSPSEYAKSIFKN
ncbi:MAG: AraC family transcriptional regulator [Clostridia bacterium]|nr:AraC family transcriptional regulator [Clostridia bacterium]